MKKFSIVLTVLMALMVLTCGPAWAEEEETITKGSVPKDRTVYSEYEKAYELYNQGKYRDAIDILEKYVKETPDPWGYWLLGYSHYKLGEHDIANKYFRQAFLVDPSFTPTPTIEKKQKSPYKDARPLGYPKGARRPVPEDTKLRLDQGTAVIVEPETKEPAPAKPAPAPAHTPAPVPAPEPEKAPEEKVEAAPAEDIPAPGEIPAPGDIPAPGEVISPPVTEEPSAAAAPPHGEVAPAHPAQPVEPQPEEPTTPSPPSPSAQPQQQAQPVKPAIKPVPGEPTPKDIIAVISAMIFVILGVFVVASIIIGVFIYLLAKKLEVRLPILGFVPVIQFWTLASCAGMSTLMTILLFLLMFIFSPIALAIIFMQVADRLGKNKILGLLLGLFLPIVPLIWFAFSRGTGAAAGGAMGGMGEMPDLSAEPQVPDLDFDLEEDDTFGGGLGEEPFGEEPISELPEMPEEPAGGGGPAPDEWSLPGEEDQGEQAGDDWSMPQEEDEGEQSVDDWSMPQEEDEGEQAVDDWSLPQDEDEGTSEIEPWSLDDDEENQ